MEQEIMQDIKDIKKHLANANKVNFFLIGTLIIIGLTIMATEYFTKDNFSSDAATLFEKAEYEKLETLISKRKSEKPNDPYLYMYLAKVEIIQGKNEEAANNLAYLKKIAPSWQESTIKPMLESIQDSASNKSFKDAP